jgi:hypothetical protein
MIGAGSSPERCRWFWYAADPLLPFVPFVPPEAPFVDALPDGPAPLDDADVRRGDRRRSVVGILLQL